MNTKHLTKALGFFSEKYMYLKEESFDELDRNIENGTLNLDQLRLEFRHALKNNDFDWIQLAKNTELLERIDNYSSRDIKIHAMVLLYDKVFPNKAATQKELLEASAEVENILKEHAKNNNNWVSFNEIFPHFNNDPRFSRIREHDLWKLIPNIENVDRYLENYEKQYALNYIRLPHSGNEISLNKINKNTR